ncbi:hypothetical protein NPIL_608841 [Nephila pilipes]|uniref:Uncharacterized protein n=1 Tax=Nephila pilipes TaxID=299642 RepID=A0A8X6IZV4_NEPPI|nr:hypothetical protein NPIL_608841 [Nephila pilipes]
MLRSSESSLNQPPSATPSWLKSKKRVKNRLFTSFECHRGEERVSNANDFSAGKRMKKEFFSVELSSVLFILRGFSFLREGVGTRTEGRPERKFEHTLPYRVRGRFLMG